MLTMAPDIDEAFLMPIETPILKVSRPVAACSRCRSAKIKCDGKLPACSACDKAGRAAECTSTNDQFARGKERSYVSTLETKIEKLKARLEEAKARKPSVVEPEDDMHSMSRRQSHQIPQPPAAPGLGNKTTRRKETNAIDDLVSNFGFLSVNATARDFYGFTSSMSYARLILWACSKDPLPDGMIQPLPARNEANKLIQHYLSNVYVLLPVFDEATFYASVDNVYSRNSEYADPNDHWSVRIVLAISCASKSEQRGDKLYLEAIGHICAALNHSESVFYPGAISSIQALVLLTEFAMLDPHHFDSWGLIGAASRAMVDLGLHQDPPKGTMMPKAKLELRRRVYYCVYALDRSTSLVQTRAFSFSDDSAKVKVPFQRSPSSAPTTPQPGQTQNLWSQSYDHALDLISLRMIQSAWYTDMFQSGRTRWNDPYVYIWKTCNDMRSWFEKLPASTSTNMRSFFELELLYSYVYVLSPCPRVPHTSPYAQILVFEYCIRYAEIILTLLSDTSYTSPLTFYDAMRVYMTGRQFLEVLQNNMDRLLAGDIPAEPEAKQSALRPPPIPSVNLPPGESVLHFNTVRSIVCIKRITECLSRFGIRWGYMSWNQRYQSETAGMLDELHGRLRALEGVRRPSAWHHQNSTGSLDSSHGGSMSYEAAQSFDLGSSPYQQSTSPPMSMGPGYRHQSISMATGQMHVGQQTSPPLYGVQPAANHQDRTNHLLGGISPPLYGAGQQQYFAVQQQPQQFYPSPPMDMQPGQYAPQQPPPPFHHQGAMFNFNDAVPIPQPVPFAAPNDNPVPPSTTRQSHHPTMQFANWSGYAGVGGQPDTLDEENAVPPEGNPWRV